jgi:hypothetical protein
MSQEERERGQKMIKTIKSYAQVDDIRWYAGEVKPERIGVGASKPSDFLETDTSKGVCFALCVWWIIKRANGEDYWAWQSGPGQHVADIKDLFRQQKKQKDAYWRFDLAKKTIESKTQLRQRSKYLMDKSADFKEPGYYYVSIRGKSRNTDMTSGHAIAAYLNPQGKCRYFDPNYGEYEADTPKEFLQALTDIVRGYKVSDLKIYHCCFG